MRTVSVTLARYLVEYWTNVQGGLSHAAGVYLSLEERQQQALCSREESICILKDGLAYVGVLDKQGRVLCVRLETALSAEHLPQWDFESAGISPVRLLRLDAELTQTELARRAGCAQKDISRWETGVRNPTPETMGKLRKAVERAEPAARGAAVTFV